jgi:hypothetical protein
MPIKSSALRPDDWVGLRDGRSAQILDDADNNLRPVYIPGTGRVAVWVWEIETPTIQLTSSQIQTRDAGRKGADCRAPADTRGPNSLEGPRSSPGDPIAWRAPGKNQWKGGAMRICSDCFQGHHSLGRGRCLHKPRILLDYGTGGRSSGLACNCRCEARPYNRKEVPNEGSANRG